MSAPLSDAAREVAEAIAMTRDRTAADGSPWCPPGDAGVVQRWVTDRSRELGGGIRRIVRLARLLALAEGSYLKFLHVRIPTLRARHFKAALHAASAAGRLPQAVAIVSASGARLREAKLLPPDAMSFDIDFAQMPRLAALLDVLHNALGFAPVEDLLKPVLARGPPSAHADEVARALHAKFNAWLSERLESPHYIRQAQKMRAFLAGRGAVTPDAVDDEAILSFWMSAAALPGDSEAEGLRLYRSSARAMLRYRRALRDAAAYRQIGTPLAWEDDLERRAQARADAIASEVWRSPLWALAARPAGAVKWLNKKERLCLLNYLGGPHPDREDPEEEAEATEPPAEEAGLDDAERFDLKFVRTLIRADVFGPVQANLVAGLRRRLPPAAAIEQALPPADAAAYEACAASYETVREQLRLECLAALVPLLEAGASEVLHLVSYLGGRDALSELLAPDAGEAALDEDADSAKDDSQDGAPGKGIGAYVAALQRIAAAGPALEPAVTIQKLIADANTAVRKVGRIGFRREDRGEPAMVAALAAGAAAIVDVLRELDRLLPALPQAHGALTADRQLFETTFRRIYSADARRG